MNLGHYFILYSIVFLVSACGALDENEGKVNLDLDDDGAPNHLDCDPTDPSKWQILLYGYEDNDADGYYSEASGQICSGANLPEKYLANISKTDELDCNDHSSNEWRMIKAFHDRDGDGIGSEDSGLICTGHSLPEKLSALSYDCNDSNDEVWIYKNYRSRDLDRDGVRINLLAQVCAGSSLPSGYFTNSSSENDCNDLNPNIWRLQTLYRDNDEDRYGAGPSTTKCIGNYPPRYYAINNSDCDDSNTNLYSAMEFGAIDEDGDSYQLSANGQVCTNGKLPAKFKAEFDYSKQPDCNDNNPTIWTQRSYLSTDLDHDGYPTNKIGNVCSGNSLPSGYRETPTKYNDCDDTNPRVWHEQTLYSDEDEDGYGAGEGTLECIGNGLPKGLAFNNIDCNDNDRKTFLSLTYIATDNDQDGYLVATYGKECTGGELSNIYKSTYDDSKAHDCDDHNQLVWETGYLYWDGDNDTYGTGNMIAHCYGDSLPEQWVKNGTDCNDDDHLLWKNEYLYPDTDNDGYGNSEFRELQCIGDQTPDGYVHNGSDCNDMNTEIWRTQTAYYDIDNDGVGAGTLSDFCTNSSPAPSTSSLGYDCDDNDPSIYRNLVIYKDLDNDGIGSGKGVITCLGNKYLEKNTSIYGFDPEPSNPEISNFDLNQQILFAQ